ncbi:MAG TPA: hypothetical protein VK973_08200 [Arenicellales bacterium]|nr:hypothetical protein [Arenicellales bacterium]
MHGNDLVQPGCSNQVVPVSSPVRRGNRPGNIIDNGIHEARESWMIILGNYSDRLIGNELLAEAREQITVFCGVPRASTQRIFEETERDTEFNAFVADVYARSYSDEAYESERREIIDGYTDAIMRSVGVRTPDESIHNVATMLGDDALAYYVARSAGCAYAPMNGASMNLGPRGRLFDNSREHSQAIQSGVPCFSQFTLFQFFVDERPFAGDRFPRGREGNGFEIATNFKHYGLMIDNVWVYGEPEARDTEVHLIENNLIVRVPHERRASRMFSNRRVIGPRVYN